MFSSSRLREKTGWNVMSPSRVRQRVLLYQFAVALAFAGLLARLWYLQVVRGEEYRAQAQRNRIEKVPLPAPRGLILARGGEVLATSRATHSVALVPAALPSAKRQPQERAALLKTLAFLLKTTPQKIEDELAAASTRGARPYDVVRIERDADLKTLARIEENKARLGPAVLITDDIQRIYPQGVLAAHLLGYSGTVTREEMDEEDIALAAYEARQNGETAPDNRSERAKKSAVQLNENIAPPRQLGSDDITGKMGLEKQYDRVLTGMSGSEEFEVDARGRPVRRRGQTSEQPGKTIQLTLNAKLQRAAEKALDAARNSGAVAVIDPRNGEILALASRPTFDPNIFALQKKDFQKKWLAINANTKHPLINRAVTSRFPPGSTFKPITAAAGLQSGTITTSTQTYCKGGLKLGRFFGCWSVHGAQDFFGAMAHSCDVFFYQEALRFGNPESSGPTYLAKIARQFGLGSVTGIDLPVEAKGLIPDPAWRKKAHAKRPALQRWFPGNTLNMSIGQGDVLATPLQMALATGAVANGGTLWAPHLLREIRDSKTNRVLSSVKPKGKNIGIAPQHLDDIAWSMRTVVTKGTGKAVALPQVAIAGKTGSAEDANNALPHAWFTCFAPYDRMGKTPPRIAIAVIVENSGHGSDNAVPIARRVLEAAFPTRKKP